MKRALLVAIGGVVAAGAAGLTYRHMSEPVVTAAPAPRETAPADPQPAARPKFAQATQPKTAGTAPDFTLRDLDGRHVTLSDYRERQIVILDFWATWCGPCIMSMPVIDRVASRHQKDVKVLSINQRETADRVREFADSKLSKAPHILLDLDGGVSTMYRVYGIPMLFVIDKQGVVRHRLTGYRPDLEAYLESAIEPLL